MKKLLLVVAALSAAILSCPGQTDHAYIKQLIDERGAEGFIALEGDNEFYTTDGVPEKLLAELQRIQKKDVRIVDVQHTDKGSWIVIYGDNDYTSSLLGHPSLYRTMVAKLNELKQKKIPIRSLSFCEVGYWAIITEGSADDENADSSIESIGELQGLLGQQGAHGNVLAVYFSGNAGIAVYENGSVQFGEISPDLLDMVANDNEGVTDLSFCGQSWFLSKGESNYAYDY